MHQRISQRGLWVSDELLWFVGGSSVSVLAWNSFPFAIKSCFSRAELFPPSRQSDLCRVSWNPNPPAPAPQTNTNGYTRERYTDKSADLFAWAERYLRSVPHIHVMAAVLDCSGAFEDIGRNTVTCQHNNSTIQCTTIQPPTSNLQPPTSNLQPPTKQ